MVSSGGVKPVNGRVNVQLNERQREEDRTSCNLGVTNAATWGPITLTITRNNASLLQATLIVVLVIR